MSTTTTTTTTTIGKGLKIDAFPSVITLKQKGILGNCSVVDFVLVIIFVTLTIFMGERRRKTQRCCFVMMLLLTDQFERKVWWMATSLMLAAYHDSYISAVGFVEETSMRDVYAALMVVFLDAGNVSSTEIAVLVLFEHIIVLDGASI